MCSMGVPSVRIVNLPDYSISRVDEFRRVDATCGCNAYRQRVIESAKYCPHFNGGPSRLGAKSRKLRADPLLPGRISIRSGHLHMQPQQEQQEIVTTIVGWREPVGLPDWGIRAIKTKIDTGARTSAIHVDRLEELPGDRVRFDVIVSAACERSIAHIVKVESDVVRTSRVKPSTGERQERLVVRTRMKLGDVEREIELSLVSRHGMLCRLLLGRTALKGFLVDPSSPKRLARPPGTKRRRT